MWRLAAFSAIRRLHGDKHAMRIAFIGHIYHRKTGSSDFLLDLIAPHGQVERFSVDDLGGAAYRSWRRDFEAARYDLIIVWQVQFVLADLPGDHPNVVFVPMYDAQVSGGRIHWNDALSARKIVCFSRTLHDEIEPYGVSAYSATYFPDPAKYESIDNFDDLRGFFWYRRQQIPPELIFKLMENYSFARLELHNAPDPGHESAGNWPCPPAVGALNITTWSSANADYRAILRGCNVFFAPRLYEGIGLSLLEAMASGMCVIAPDRPTMNEYVRSGENGLLYDPNAPHPLDFSKARELGSRARQTVEEGFTRWQAQIPGLLDFVLQPGSGRVAGRAVKVTPRARALGMLNTLKRRWPALGALVGAAAVSVARLVRRAR